MSKHIKGFKPAPELIFCPNCGHFNTDKVEARYPYRVCVLCDHVFPARGVNVPRNVWLREGMGTIETTKMGV